MLSSSTPDAGSPPLPGGGRKFFRVAAHAQDNFPDAEPGFFYVGSCPRARHVLSVGATHDFQDDYKYWTFDGIVDMPRGPGVGIAQINVAQWDGGTLRVAPLPSLQPAVAAIPLLADHLL